ncbi:MAG TPA: dienelactone hydrolase family protein, partial [Thermoanaerobaculia bacterium]
MRALFLSALSCLLLVPAVARADDEKDTMQRMAQEHQHDKPSASPAAMEQPAQPVDAEEVTYGEAGGKPLHGYAARPKSAKSPLPGIIVIHEWWGLNDNIRAMTRRLAGEGYQALAVDLYGGSHAENPDDAMKLVKGVQDNPGAAQESLRRAAAWLEGKGAKKLGVIGWCFGGGWSLNTALLMPDKIDATVIYYGHLETDKAKLAPLKMPVIGFFGGKDQGITPESVHAFEKAMKELGKDVEVHIYEDADHAFANASGGNYNAKDAEDAWTRTTAFLRKN